MTIGPDRAMFTYPHDFDHSRAQRNADAACLFCKSACRRGIPYRMLHFSICKLPHSVYNTDLMPCLGGGSAPELQTVFTTGMKPVIATALPELSHQWTRRRAADQPIDIDL